MKLTASQLRKIIKEEVAKVVAEAEQGYDPRAIDAALESADPRGLAGATAVALNFLLANKLPVDVLNKVLRQAGDFSRNAQIETVRSALAQAPGVAVQEDLARMLGLY